MCEVREQSGDRLVDPGAALQRLSEVAMMIPTTGGDLDETDPGFSQSPRHQAPAKAAVSSSSVRRARSSGRIRASVSASGGVSCMRSTSSS